VSLRQETKVLSAATDHVIKQQTRDMKDVLVWAMCNARVKDDFVKMFCLPLSENRLVTLPNHLMYFK